MQFVINIFLALVWAFLHTSYTFVTFAVGFVLGAIIIFLVNLVIGVKIPTTKRTHKRFYLYRVLIAIKLLLIFLKDMVAACFLVLRQVFQPKLKIRPGIIKMNIYLDSPLQITLLANMITLTPGTLTMEVAKDNSALYIHTLDIGDADAIIAHIERHFEKNIWEVFH